MVSEIPEIVNDLDKQEERLILKNNAHENGIAGKSIYNNDAANSGAVETKQGKEAAEVMYG